MPSSLLQFWTVRLTTFLLWALAAGSAAFWILQNMNASVNDSANPNANPAARASSTQEPSLTHQVALALGAKNPVAPTAAGALAAMQARLQLQGVLAVGTKQGAALISVDGKPAKPYRVGSAIEDGLEVTAVGARSASIGKSDAAAFTLELPSKN
jgi:general secretion pathway protein C